MAAHRRNSKHAAPVPRRKDKPAPTPCCSLLQNGGGQVLPGVNVTEPKYPPIAPIWRRYWQEVIPFFAYPLEVRKIIYTTDAIESLNMQVRKVIKNRGHFPNDEAALRLIYLALRNITKNGRCHPSLGVLPKPNSPFCSANVSRIQFEDAVKFNRDFGHTKLLTLPGVALSNESAGEI